MSEWWRQRLLLLIIEYSTEPASAILRTVSIGDIFANVLPGTYQLGKDPGA